MTTLDGWEQIGIPGHGGGSFIATDAPWRGVLHSTEGTSVEGAVSSYTTNGVPPQCTIDPLATRKVQHIDLDRSAYALVHPSGVETNRLKCIQVEIVMFADLDKARQYHGLHVGDLNDAHYAFISECLREIAAAVPIEATFAAPFVPYPSSYGTGAAQRFDAGTWTAFGGWCGHQHVYGNEHGDPGALDTSRIHLVGDDTDVLNTDDKDWLTIEFTALHDRLKAVEAENANLKAAVTALGATADAEERRNIRRVAMGLDAAGTRILGIEGAVPEYPAYKPK